MRILSHGDTDPGRARPNNEDAYLRENELGLFAVADGVGGREAGEVASAIAVDTLREALPDLLGSDDRTPPAGTGPEADRVVAALRRAVSLANSRILATIKEQPDKAGMGTTLTTVLFSGTRVVIAQVGDSRAYRLRKGKLVQLTEDHSFVAEQVRAGVLTTEQAKTSAHRHVITRALGLAEEILPDLQGRDVKAGDTYLLCTDGLTEMVEDDEIREIILASASPENAVRMLIDAANERGGADNITAVVVKVLEGQRSA